MPQTIYRQEIKKEAMRYLHFYRKESDFVNDYNEYTSITAITVSGAMKTGECGTEPTQTQEFNGKYVFNREVTASLNDYCNPQETPTDMTFRVFKLGNREIYDVCNGGACLSEQGSAMYIQDFSQAGAPGDARLIISSVEYGENPYHEPWVSYTIDTDEGKEHVDYNKTKGNKIVISYVDKARACGPEIISYTDDFTPASTGATYEFRFTNNPPETYVVGEIYEGNWTFNGSWWADSDGGVITGLTYPQSGWVYVRGNHIDGFDIQCGY